MGARYSRQVPQIVVVPAPWQGHANPITQLCKILSRDYEVHILMPVNPMLRVPSIPRGARYRVILHKQQIVEEDPNLTAAEYHVKIFTALSLGRDKLIDEACRIFADINPRAVVYDTFVVWGRLLARTMKVPCAAFYPSPALYVVLQRRRYVNANLDEIPGFGRIDPNEFPEQFSADPATVEACRRFFDDVVACMGLADMMLVNDSSALYRDGTLLRQAVAQDLEFSCDKRAQFLGLMTDVDVRAHEIAPNDSVTAWLASHPVRSVIYFATGTVFDLTEANIEAMGSALLRTGCPVLWANRESLDCPERAPMVRAFEAKSNGRIKVFSWVNQITVLRHKSVALFISHCGWNSVAECLTLCGVPILCLPHAADQSTVAHIVSRLGIGLIGCLAAMSMELDPDVVESQIKELLTNPAFADKAKAFKETFHTDGRRQHERHQALRQLKSLTVQH